jgi:predicted GNAT family acetyltransferase
VAEIPVTLDQCLKLARDWTRYGLPLGVTVLGSDAVANRVWEEYARLAAKLSDARSQMMTLKAAKHQEKSGPSKDEKTQEQGLRAQLAEQRALQVEIDSIERSLNAKRQIFEHLQEANRAAHKVLRNVCRQEYPELFPSR